MSEQFVAAVERERHAIQAPASDPELAFLELSRCEDVYVLGEAGRVIHIPCASLVRFGDLLPDDAACSVFGYEGNPDVDAWEPTEQPFRADAARWFTVADLLTYPRLTRQEAQSADPKLFGFLAAVDGQSGVACDESRGAEPALLQRAAPVLFEGAPVSAAG